MARKRAIDWRVALGAAAVAAAILLVFSRTWINGTVDWDDPDVLLRNLNIRGLGLHQIGWMFTTFYWGHYQPLVWLSYAFDYQWCRALLGAGLDPRGYHVTSSLLHAANAVLVYFLGIELLNKIRGTAGGRPAAPVLWAAAFAGLLFGLHPLRVEPVAWITGRGDLLATLFLLLAIKLYMRAVEADESRSRRTGLSLALGLYGLSLLSRAMGVTLPLILLLLDWYPLRRLGWGPGRWFGSSAWPVWREKLPFAVLAAGAMIIAPLAKAHAGSTLVLSVFGLPQRIALACYGLVFYLWKTAVPLNLIPIYELHVPMDIFAPRYVASAVVVTLAVAGLIVLRRRRAGLIAGAMGYAILLAPVLGFVQSGNQEVADRYCYLASIPVALMVSALGLPVWSRSQRGRAGRTALIAVAVIAVVACGALARRQCAVWSSTETLWSYTGRRAPDSSIAQNGLGYVLLQQGKLEESVNVLRRAIQLQPTNEKAHNNLWEALRRSKRDDELYAAYVEAARVLPASASARYNLGNELLRRGKLDEAIEQLRVAVSLDDRNAEAHGLLALALLQQGNVTESIREHELALERNPRLVPARLNLARALEQQGRIAEAIEQLREAIKLDPGNASAKRELDRLTG